MSHAFFFLEENGIFPMHVEDFAKYLTRLDCSEFWHPLDYLDKEGQTQGLTSLQLTGFLSKEKSNGAAYWWRNPRYKLTLKGEMHCWSFF